MSVGHRGGDLSTNLKLTALVMASFASLWVGAAGLVVVDQASFRRAFESELGRVAGMVERSVAPSLVFRDRDATAAALRTLEAQPRVRFAYVTDDDGDVYAYYDPRGLAESSSTVRRPPSTPSYTEGSVSLARPIVYAGERIGTLYIDCDTTALDARRRGYLWFLAGLLLVLFALALALSFAARSIAWKPIRDLDDAVKIAAKAEDYTLGGVVEPSGAVGELTSSLNAMLSRAQSVVADLTMAKGAAEHANVAKSHFLANMSHELRTPLSSIIGYAEMLEEEATDASPAELVQDSQRIRAAAKHLLALIDQVLDLSKIEAGKMELVLADVPVDALVDEVARTVEPLVKKNRNTLEVRCSADAGTMFADAMRVRQILFNLLSNACKFTENGAVVLDVDRAEGNIRFRVSDTGIGMTPEQTERIFEAFQQADALTSHRYGGTGLGLVICREFCQLAGGDIEVSSEYGKGTTFTVQLPAGGPQANSHRAILVIDDEPGARDLISERLTEDRFHVVTAASAEEGLRLARALRPQAITVDAMLPDIEGTSVLHSLKTDDELRLIPIFVIAVRDGEEMEPFSLDLLANEIGALVRTKP